MPKLNVGASAYQVRRGKAEIARAAKWQKTAKLTAKKSLESKKPKPGESDIESGGGQDSKKIPETADPDR